MDARPGDYYDRGITPTPERLHPSMTPPIPDLLCSIVVGRQDNGRLYARTEFAHPEAQPIIATADDPDLGLNEADTVIHDVAHLLLCVLASIDGSPVLERVAGIRPGGEAGVCPVTVELEEAAVFALQAYVRFLADKAAGQ